MVPRDFFLRFPDYKFAIMRDTGRSFETIFMKFTWWVPIHQWVNPIVFGNNRPNRTTGMGENVPPKPVFCIYLTGTCFFEEQSSKLYSVPHFAQKRLYSFLSSDAPFPRKWSCPPKSFFCSYVGKGFFFFFLLRKNC